MLFLQRSQVSKIPIVLDILRFYNELFHYFTIHRKRCYFYNDPRCQKYLSFLIFYDFTMNFLIRGYGASQFLTCDEKKPGGVQVFWSDSAEGSGQSQVLGQESSAMVIHVTRRPKVRFTHTAKSTFNYLFPVHHPTKLSENVNTVDAIDRYGDDRCGPYRRGRTLAASSKRRQTWNDW